MNYKWLILAGIMIGLVPGTFLGGVFLRRDFAGNTPPLASLTFTPNIIRAGDVVSFNASSSRDPDGSITHYAWNFGDGATAIGVLAVFNQRESICYSKIDLQ